ncbi:hypothetical protein D9758_000055 [Tetrapyrgos nigripes]|uniref:Natural resistance-associated macrophage protein n=1 Tax=Tetrapyrgos nigripes TaxID=182062 RepID=A0A8H5H1U9_9AGAR|nr:hypothetical protein D9758_000055 [Tetrapyrgos nigripes]
MSVLNTSKLTNDFQLFQQCLACRLGCVTGIDLASHCRLLLHNCPRHPKLVRRAVLYPLYACAEIAIISTDLAELLGSAVGISLLFPSLPLWAAVLITAADVIVFLFIADPSNGGGRPVRIFEFIIIALVMAVFSCFVVLLVGVRPHWPAVFLGYIPSKDLFKAKPDAVYSAVGILGATIMPHALFLGSYLSTQDRVSKPEENILPPPVTISQGPVSQLKLLVSKLFKVSRAERVASAKDYRSRHGERENNSLLFIQQHLKHGMIDVISSLSLVAFPINSAILILAATVFFNNDLESGTTIGLFDAHELIKSRIGPGSAVVFALALICAGQTSSITATLAGQVVSEGFIEWRVSPFLRRLITRLMGLVPSVVVALAVGRDGIDRLLVASQVILSVVLPFVAFPLIYLSSSTLVMRVRNPDAPSSPLPLSDEVDKDASDDEKAVVQQTPNPISPVESPTDSLVPLPASDEENRAGQVSLTSDVLHVHPQIDTTSNESESSNRSSVVIDTYHRNSESENMHPMPVPIPIPIKDETYLDFAVGRVVMMISYAIWTIILVANVYALVMLGLGQTG